MEALLPKVRTLGDTPSALEASACVSRPLVSFVVLNDNLIKELILFVSVWAGHKSTCTTVITWIYLYIYNMWSKWNCVINVWCQLMNDSVLENIWQLKHGKYNGQEDNECTWSNTIWLLIIKKWIDQVLLLSNEYLWKQPDHMKKTIIDIPIQKQEEFQE
jgi:hypothetical protein